MFVVESIPFLPIEPNGVGTVPSAGTVLVANEPSLHIARRHWMVFAGLRLMGGAAWFGVIPAAVDEADGNYNPRLDVGASRLTAVVHR